jgi:hypothetical protein
MITREWPGCDFAATRSYKPESAQPSDRGLASPAVAETLRLKSEHAAEADHDGGVELLFRRLDDL